MLSFPYQLGQGEPMLFQVCKGLNAERMWLVHGSLCNLLVRKSILITVRKLWMPPNLW